MAAAAQLKIKSYLEKHKVGNLFEELYGHLLQDQPDDPLLYLTRILQRKVDLRKPQSSSPSRSKAISSTMPAAALSSSTDATAEKPDKSDAVKLSTASKLKSKPSSGPSLSRSVAFAPGPATPEPPQKASAQPEATLSSTVAANSSGLHAPVMIKADAIPEKSALDRELKPSADNPEDSDESDLDDRLARKREDKLSRGKKVSSAKDARKRELAEKLARMKADAGASAPVPQVTPIGPSAPSDAPEENYEALEKELGVQSVKQIKKPKKEKKEKKPDVQVRVALCARCASIIQEGELASGNGMRPPLWLSGDALVDDEIESTSASLLEASRGAGGGTVLTRRIPSASASPRSSSILGQRGESGNGTGLPRNLLSSNGPPATGAGGVAGAERLEGPESVRTSYAWQTVVDSDTESVSGSRSRSRGGTGAGGSRPATAGSATGNTGRF